MASASVLDEICFDNPWLEILHELSKLNAYLFDLLAAFFARLAARILF